MICRVWIENTDDPIDKARVPLLETEEEEVISKTRMSELWWWRFGTGGSATGRAVSQIGLSRAQGRQHHNKVEVERPKVMEEGHWSMAW